LVFDRHPVLKRALLNQYQLILAASVAAASLGLESPLPVLLFIGCEVLSLPFLLERTQRRLEVEKNLAERREETLSQEQRYDQLAAEAKARLLKIKRTCGQIQENYKSLSPASQDVLGEQVQKFSAIQATALRRLWLVQKYEQMIRSLDIQQIQRQIEALRLELAAPDTTDRIRDAWQQNLEIKEKLLETAERNVLNRTALLAELDSLETLLQLLQQKSIAATDAEAFSTELDTILSQAEADAASVQEMEELMGSIPELQGRAISENIGRAANEPLPFSPRNARGREKR
jgi:hypothetical protein